jgi:hypothetical protein
MNHPQIQGVFVSANTPQVLDDWQIGWQFNTQVVSKNAHGQDTIPRLVCEAWVDVGKVNALGGDSLDALERLDAGEPVEVSTGCFVSTYSSFGSFGGREYFRVWDEIVPDHLALLSAGVLGACSIADGCGANRVNVRADQMPVTPANPTGLSVNSSALRIIDHQCECGGTCGGCNHDSPGGSSMPKANVNTAPVVRSKPEKLRPNKVVQTFLSQMSINAMPEGVMVSDILNILGMAIKDMVVDSPYVYCISATTDIVVFCAMDSDWNMAYYQIPFTMDASGNVHFSGPATEVVLMTKIMPAPDVSRDASADPDNDGDVDLPVPEGYQQGSGRMLIAKTQIQPNASGDPNNGGGDPNEATGDGILTPVGPPVGEGHTYITQPPGPLSTPEVPFTTPTPLIDGFTPPNVGEHPENGHPMTTSTNTGAPASGAPAATAVTAAAATPAVQAAPSIASVETYLASMPPEVANTIRASMAASAARKAKLIGDIKANKSNTFSDAQLEAMDVTMLEGIGAMAVQGSQHRQPSYQGRAASGHGIEGAPPREFANEAETPMRTEAPKVFEGKVTSSVHRPNQAPASHDYTVTH